MIQEWHSAFYRGRHAHLILFHAKFDEIGLDVCIEKTIQKRTGRLFPKPQNVGVLVAESWPYIIGEQANLIRFRERSVKIVEVEGSPRSAVPCQERVT